MNTVLDVAGVSKSFGVRVVDEVSFSVERGEALGIIGPNGAGKTTLLNLIAGDLRLDSGTIRVNDADVTARRADWRCRAGIGRTSQIPRPFGSMTVFENVLLASTYGSRARGRNHRANEEAVDALERSGLIRHANRMAGELPLLDRKRLELARALATQPTILLLDEIAGGLTEAEVLELVDSIRQLKAEGLTIVWIEHIVHALLAVVDRIVAMNFGRIMADGEPNDVMRSAQVQEIYLGVAPA